MAVECPECVLLLAWLRQMMPRESIQDERVRVNRRHAVGAVQNWERWTLVATSDSKPVLPGRQSLGAFRIELPARHSSNSSASDSSASGSSDSEADSASVDAS